MNLIKLVRNFWLTTKFSIEFTSLLLAIKLGNTLEKKRAGGHLLGPAAQREAWPRATAGPATAQGGEAGARDRFCKGGPVLFGNQTTQ